MAELVYPITICFTQPLKCPAVGPCKMTPVESSESFVSYRSDGSDSLRPLFLSEYILIMVKGVG